MEDETNDNLSTYSDDEVDFLSNKSSRKFALLLSDNDDESGREDKSDRTEDKQEKELSDTGVDDSIVGNVLKKGRKFSRVKNYDSSDSEKEDNMSVDSAKEMEKQDESISKTIHLKNKVSPIDFSDTMKGTSSDHKNNDDKEKEAAKKTNSKTKNKKDKEVPTEIDEILKESQRMVRESVVSLPYHVPRQRTLQDFLNRRKSVPKIPLKSNLQELSIVWKHIEECEKTAESFYNSESEESDKEKDNEKKLSSNAEVSVNLNKVVEKSSINISDDLNNNEEFSNHNLTKSLLESLDKSSAESSSNNVFDKSASEKLSNDKSLTPGCNSLLNKIPKLSCGPGDEIDLDQPIGGVDNFFKRFMKHVKLKNAEPKKEKAVKLSVLNVESGVGGEITSLAEEELIRSCQETKPGQKLCALKQTLKKSIAVSRSQRLAKRIEQFKIYEQEFYDEDEGKPEDQEDNEKDKESEDEKESIDEMVEEGGYSDEESTGSEVEEARVIHYDSETNWGSFLGRSERVLSKLAGLAAPTDQQQQRVKRNMVFSVVSPPKAQDAPTPELEKRKANGDLPRVTKKLKFNQSATKTTRSLGIIQKLMDSDT